MMNPFQRRKLMCVKLSAMVSALWFAASAYASQPDPVMMSDIAALRERVVRATDPQRIDSVYLAAKAQSWLDFVQEERIELDDTGVAEDALQRAHQIIAWLENKQPEGKPLPETLRGTMRVRDDLWARLSAAQKKVKTYSCAAPYLAKAEVQLVWAAHEHPELGPRHGAPFIQEAEFLLEKAECCVVEMPPVAKVPPVVAVPPVVEVPPVQIPPVVVPPVIPVPSAPPVVGIPLAVDKLPDAVHFAFDRFNISPESDKVLHIVADTLRAYPWLTLELGGHTDRRGKQSYNLKLSQRRVLAVHRRLVELGVPASRFVTRAHGMTKLLMKADDKLARSLDRRVELIITNPNDPAAVIKVHSEAQKGDLQQ